MSLLFLNRGNAKVKPIESNRPSERYQVDIVLIQTLYDIDFKIFLQWEIISQRWKGSPIKLSKAEAILAA